MAYSVEQPPSKPTIRPFGQEVVVPDAPTTATRGSTIRFAVWISLGAFLVAASGAALARKMGGSDVLIVVLLAVPAIGASGWNAWRGPPRAWDGVRRSLLTTWIMVAGFVLSLPVGIEVARVSDSVRENPGIAVVLVVMYGLLASLVTGSLGFAVGHARARRILRKQSRPPRAPHYAWRTRK